MSNPLRFAPAFTAIAMASAIAGCAAPQFGTRSASNFAGKVDHSNIGVATKALAALEANDYPTAVKLAERAVQNSPNDAGFRSLLGNAYFASGRFASAEAAFSDSLALIGDQPQVVLKLALVQIAQGRASQAQSLLQSARNSLDPADYGLAVALAGQPQDAVNVLEPAARQVGADARVRQNLALAYALAGDWDSARAIAAQDLSADLVDARIQQWMTFAKPAHASDQVAALTGFRPVAGDPGQPTRLALRSSSTRTAQAALDAQPQQAVAVPQPEPQPVAALAAEPVAQYVPPSEPVVEQVAQAAAVPAPAPVAQTPSAVIETVATAIADAPVALAEMAGFKKPQPKKAKAAVQRAPLHRASLSRASGKSTTVLQLGAYGSPERVVRAWDDVSRRYSMLRAYSPMSARFNSSKGLVYRLSVRGFASASEAKDMCLSLRRAGGSCFVRTVAGDQPVRIASR